MLWKVFSDISSIHSMELVISVTFCVGPSMFAFSSWKNPLTRLPRKFNTGRFGAAFGLGLTGRFELVVDVVLQLYIPFNF